MQTNVDPIRVKETKQMSEKWVKAITVLKKIEGNLGCQLHFLLSLLR